MEKLNIKNFEEGLEYILTNILEGKDKPVLVSVHGVPHSGKTEFRKRIHYSAEKLGKKGWIGMCGDSLDKFKIHTETPDYFIMEDTQYVNGVDMYTEQNFGKLPDLRVYISKNFSFDPISPFIKLKMEEGLYGLIIENPQASERNKL